MSLNGHQFLLVQLHRGGEITQTRLHDRVPLNPLGYGAQLFSQRSGELTGSVVAACEGVEQCSADLDQLLTLSFHLTRNGVTPDFLVDVVDTSRRQLDLVEVMEDITQCPT